MRSTLSVLALAAALSVPLAAHADCSDDAASAPSTASVRYVHGQRVYDFGTRNIHCTPQGPYQFSVTSRHAPEWTASDVPQHFVPDVVSAVRRTPF
jgi:hypothetical protein